MIDTQSWTWHRVGTNDSPAFLGTWQARAYVAEGPLGWYAAGEGQKTGPEYVYRLPGLLAPSGPHTRGAAEAIALQMIGLAADASCPGPDQVVLFREPAWYGRKEYEAQDVTGGRWALAAGGANGAPHQCIICTQVITDGWSEGPWRNARRFICVSHVEVRLQARPATQGLPSGSRLRRTERALQPGTVDTGLSGVVPEPGS